MRIFTAATVFSLALVGGLAEAQTNVATETNLRSGVARQPLAIGNYLDLAKLYFEQGRYDEAERMLAEATALIRRQRTQSVSFGPPARQQAPRTMPGAGADFVRIGGDIQEPKKLRDVKPIYPEIARAAQVQGIVIVDVLVDEQGEVADARVLRSVALLDEAALDAVRQWRFMPTLVNGVPTPVRMTVTVNFRLPG